MPPRKKASATRRKRALGRMQKLRGSLKGKPSPLDLLLKDRRENFQREESRFKRGRG